MKINQVLSNDEIKQFLVKSDWQGTKTLVFNWGIIAASFLLVSFYPNILTILLAIILIGGRQLGLGVLMHDCSHAALFKNKKINEFVGKWFCAYPIFFNLETYRKVHLQHHAKAGTTDDPDLPNYKNYPVSKASLRRKILRDLSGRTGIKALMYSLFQSREFLSSGTKRAPSFLGPLFVNGLLFLVLFLAGNAWLYLLWLAAYLTTFMLFLRIRQIAEHGAVPDLFDVDPRNNTRTTLARWWERLTVAPNHVHYHLEHHLLATVPPHKLRELHHLLKSRGFYKNTPIAHGYGEILKRAVFQSK